jgi:hypothetical protein
MWFANRISRFPRACGSPLAIGRAGVWCYEPYRAGINFTKQHVAVLRLHGGSRDPRSLARFGGVALYECGDERGGGGQKLDCVLTEIAWAGAVDLKHAPRRPGGQHRDIDQRNNMVLPQQVRNDEILLLIEVPNVRPDRRSGTSDREATVNRTATSRTRRHPLSIRNRQRRASRLPCGDTAAP